MRYAALLLIATPVFAQTFAVASVKPSAHEAGRDARGRVAVSPRGVTARNVSLAQLIAAAYQVQPFRISGPGWLDVLEFDVDARADAPADVRLLLRNLLAERFHLMLRHESKETPVYALVVDKGGPKIHPDGAAGNRSFHGDLDQFANLLAVQLSIPATTDPTRPAIASNTPVPVVNETNLEGIYSIPVDFRPDGSDPFTLWQRILRDQLGLRLERRRSKLDYLIVDSADRTPTAN
jgi:uncharacterized protein (TIGR03435 family)